jgi:hypothetical protein
MNTVTRVSGTVKSGLILLAQRVVDGEVSSREALARVPPGKARLFKAIVASLLRRRHAPPSRDARAWAARRLCDHGGWIASLCRETDDGIERKEVRLSCRSAWCEDCGFIRKVRGRRVLRKAMDAGRWIVVTLTYPAEDPPDLAPFLEQAARDLAKIGVVDDETVRVRARALWLKHAWRRFMDLLRKERWKRIGKRYKRLWGEGLRRLMYVAVMELRPRLSGALKGEWVPHLHAAFRMAYLDINWIREAWTACGGGEIADVRRAGKGTRWRPEDAARYLAGYLASGKLRFGDGLGDLPEWDRDRLAVALRGIRLWMAAWGMEPLWPRWGAGGGSCCRCGLLRRRGPLPLILHATMLRALRLIRVQDAGFGIRPSGFRAVVGVSTRWRMGFRIGAGPLGWPRSRAVCAALFWRVVRGCLTGLIIPLGGDWG